MFEISVASKYLLPRWRQLSISIISIISILVISLVVWLIVVFFSVTDGLENSWIRKLTSLTAPVRITPSDAYKKSYYYQIDSLSHASEYTLKTIGEKKLTALSDPYDPEIDQEIPQFWPEPDLNKEGTLKDPVKLLYESISELPPIGGLKVDEFELTMSHIQLNLLRPSQSLTPHSTTTDSTLSYPMFLGHFAGVDAQLGKTLLPIQNDDINNLLYLLNSNHQHEEIKKFWDQVGFTQLKTPSSGWLIPASWMPKEAQWTVVTLLKNDQPVRIIVPESSDGIQALKKIVESDGKKIRIDTLSIHDGKPSLENISYPIPIYLEPNVKFSAQLIEESIANPKKLQDPLVEAKIIIQNTPLSGTLPLNDFLLVDGYLKNKASRFWQNDNSLFSTLPIDPEGREAILLPKNFREIGARAGDRGSLSYVMPTPSTIQEQLIPVYVAGFYDPGIIPIGGKFIIANRELTSLISSAHSSDDNGTHSNGVNLHFDHLEDAEQVKQKLIHLLKTNGIDHYWRVETFRDFEFTQGILQELQSQKTIFTLIAIVIILVACSNIISMLIILVNDKKEEIGILRSMGASSASIALIFGMAGGFIGLFSALLGVGTAIITLDHLPLLMGWISHFQGIDLFQSAFYGEMPPQELSYSALSFVLIATLCISLLAGIAPAIKACFVRPAQILRSGG